MKENYNVSDEDIQAYVTNNNNNNVGDEEPRHVTTRKAEFILCGGKFVTTDKRRDTTSRLDDHIDIRQIDTRNRWNPDTPRPTYQSNSPEAQNAQMILEIGRGADLEARTTCSGLHYTRLVWEKSNPKHRFSWMGENDDNRKGRDPSTFTSSSTGPSENNILEHNYTDYTDNTSSEDETTSGTPITSPQRQPITLELQGYGYNTTVNITDSINGSDPPRTPSPQHGVSSRRDLGNARREAITFLTSIFQHNDYTMDETEEARREAISFLTSIFDSGSNNMRAFL